MSEDVTYSMTMTKYTWKVFYHPKFDEIVLVRVDTDDICEVFRKGGMDSYGFIEFMDFSKAEYLGAL